MTRKRTLLAIAVVAVVAVVAAILLASRGDGDGTPTERETVAAPGGGRIDETVEPAPPASTRTAAPDDPVTLPGGLQVEIARTRTKSVKPGGPGEVGGNAVITRVRITNGTDEPVSLDGVTVTLVYGANQVAQPLTPDPYSPFSGSAEPGEKAEGVYVFRVPKNRSSDVSITVQPVPGGDVARFGDG